MLSWLRRSFIAGFFVTVPLVVSVVALVWAFRFADSVTGALGERLFGRPWPGLGLLATAAAILAIGALTTNVIGRRLLARSEQILQHVPLFRTVYAPVKQLISAFSPDNEFGFKRMVLVEEQGRGAVLGFLTKEFIVDRGRGPETLLAVYVPTNHLYLGDILVCSPDRASFPDLTVEEGIRIFLTGGTGIPDRLRIPRRQRKLERLLRTPRPGQGALTEMRRTMLAKTKRWMLGSAPLVLVAMLVLSVAPLVAQTQPAAPQTATSHAGGEANLILPDLSRETFMGVDGRSLLMVGVVISALGMLFGLLINRQLKNMPVHTSMLEVSELIYETCKTYLIQQGKFLMILWLFIGAIVTYYFGWLASSIDPVSGAVVHGMPAMKVAIILLFSLVGIAGSYGVAWFGIRVNTYANSRTAFASLRGKPYPCYAIPLKAGMSIGMLLISVELIIMLFILLWIPGDYAGPCFIGFAIGESLGAAALRIAGGIFTKIADIGADLMKIVFKIKEDDARNPGVIADCVGDNAGDSVGPSADGFETYGVTGVALISFILLAVTDPAIQIQLLVWIFMMRIVMVIASAGSYWINEMLAKAQYQQVDKMNYEAPLTRLVWLTSFVSVALTYGASYLLIPNLYGDTTLWWKLSTIITCGTLAGAIIPELVKVFTSTESSHVREVVTSSREGGASLNILSGLVAGNFSAYWIGLAIMALMAIAYAVSGAIAAVNPADLAAGGMMLAPAVFAFGLVAFGFLGMGPVTIAVDSYGPVTDNAQSVYELSTIEQIPGIKADLKKNFGFDADFEKAKHNLEENDGAGNTFKATAKPVLIGTAVVGATTMIFAIIVALTEGLKPEYLRFLSILHPPFLLGLITGGAMIYWFTGASTQAVTTGAYRAVEFIKANIKLEGSTKASVSDSKKVVAICTQYAQKGMFNIFLSVFFGTLAFAFAEPYFFIGYLISIALFGLFQAIFMANAGGAWDNAKKIVEVELKQKGTPLHDATVVGDTVGDPFKDTSSVAMNPVIKFTTLFGLLAVELAVSVTRQQGDSVLTHILAAVFFAVSMFFVWRSFYGMRIGGKHA